ncbi:MAG: hypothetical protein JXB03_10300, partial [Spirochaetales bacterium]|nr:hypothetical protein [Spirochaetales bacterium]
MGGRAAQIYTTTGIWLLYCAVLAVLVPLAGIHPFVILILPVILSSVVAGPYAGFGIGLVSGPFTILYLHFL